jgi:energy-coupling factor transport system permease protein
MRNGRLHDSQHLATQQRPAVVTHLVPAPSRQLPRELHPGAWWIWAIGMATAASRTTNPLLLGLIIAVLAFVVSARRGDAPWSTGFRAYVVAALVVIAIRVFLRILLDGQYGPTVLFRLPEIPLPHAAEGLRIGGPVSLEGVLGAFYDGLRLATLLLCFGAANVLANAKRLLKSTPSALHEMGVAVIVALTIAPQLIESASRVRRARKLRSSRARGFHLLHQIVIPVMTDALDRSLALAAAMDARGFGRTRRLATATRRRLSGACVLAGLCGVCIGTYSLLDASGPPVLGLPALAGGLALAATGMLLGGKRVATTRYRPDPWRVPEWLVSACGVGVAAGMFVVGRIDPDNLNPSLQPLRWPALPVFSVLVILVGALPAWLAPPPVSTAAPAGVTDASVPPVRPARVKEPA